MKRISYYLILIVVVGSTLTSFWAYQKYFKTPPPNLLSFVVERGNIQETVKVRGEVVPQKDFDLEFSFPGTIKEILVREGQQVKKDNLLMKLETTDFELEINQLRAVLAQRQANLDKLITGPIKEDLRVSETKIDSMKTLLEDVKRSYIDTLQDAYTKSDDAIRNKTDQIFDNPSSNPRLKFILIDSQLNIDIEWQRTIIENALKTWRNSLDILTTVSNLDNYLKEASEKLGQAKFYFDKATLAVSSLTVSGSLSQTTIDSYRSGVSIARANINVAITNLTAAGEKLKIVESNLQLAEDELALKKAAARTEDVAIAEAQIEETKSQIAIIKEKIKKSALYAPGDAKIVKILFEKGELSRPGQTAITLATAGHKIQSDISELEIGKVREGDGNEVLIRLDAFPDLALKGKVVSIDAKEIIKEGDKYYRASIYMEPHASDIRSGMNADLTIIASSKENALKIPEFTVYKKDGKAFVIVIDGGRQKETQIEIGISDGTSIEVIKGLNDGQTVTVAAD